MLSTVISILIFVVPIAVFLAVQFFAQQSRNKGHWPQPKEGAQQSTPGEPAASSDAPRRKARAHAVQQPSCGREVTHFLLTLTGSRGSCRHCAALEKPEPQEPIDLLAEAERIANEAQD